MVGKAEKDLLLRVGVSARSTCYDAPIQREVVGKEETRALASWNTTTPRAERRVKGTNEKDVNMLIKL